jgi:hypothetical protein
LNCADQHQHQNDQKDCAQDIFFSLKWITRLCALPVTDRPIPAPAAQTMLYTCSVPCRTDQQSDHDQIGTMEATAAPSGSYGDQRTTGRCSSAGSLASPLLSCRVVPTALVKDRRSSSPQVFV